VEKRPHNLKLRTVFCTEEIGQPSVRFASQHETDLIALAWRRNLERNGPDHADGHSTRTLSGHDLPDGWKLGKGA
jgi:hypothetical protein